MVARVFPHLPIEGYIAGAKAQRKCHEFAARLCEAAWRHGHVIERAGEIDGDVGAPGRLLRMSRTHARARARRAIYAIFAAAMPAYILREATSNPPPYTVRPPASQESCLLMRAPGALRAEISSSTASAPGVVVAAARGALPHSVRARRAKLLLPPIVDREMREECWR